MVFYTRAKNITTKLSLRVIAAIKKRENLYAVKATISVKYKYINDTMDV